MLRHAPWLTLLACVQLACVGFSQAQDSDPYAANRYDFVEIRRAIREFQQAHRRLPSDLREICPSMRGDQSCPFWPFGQPLVDQWGRPFVYELIADEYQLTSAGPDKRAQTADDISFRPSLELRFVAA